MGWGRGNASARNQIGKISREYLEHHGITRETAEQWAKHYANEALRVPGNPSAAGRADLMRHVAALLK